MSPKTRPAFWARQPRLPLEADSFLRLRLEKALAEPGQRTLLVWPTILGAPIQREAHPEGMPPALLLPFAARMVAAVGNLDPGSAWERDLQAFPDTACQGPSGWLPHPCWADVASRISLRSGVALLALTGQPEDDRYRLACGIALFNHALYHLCHEALEGLWHRSEGDLKRGLQGLILLACGYYHQQYQHAPGMRSTWRGGIEHLQPFGGILETPWGCISFAGSLAMAMQRLEWLQHTNTEDEWERFWETPSPEWEFA